jgi:phage/plasmid-associated DNA primase
MAELDFSLIAIKALNARDAKVYIDRHIIPLDDGNHAMLKKGKYVILDSATLRSTYFNRISSELKNYYFKEKDDLKTIIYDINKPVLTEKELNLCPAKLHNYKPYSEFTEEIQGKVKIMLNHLYSVLSDSDEKVYNFLLKWLSNMVRGNKNNSSLYVKGPQGCGKSTPFEFFRFHVIGQELCVETGSGPLKSKFNSELSGKLMVLFEELENFSASEWISISSVLKRQITADTIMIERKGVDAVEQQSLNNYILLSNNDAIQDDDGRRYFILPINTKHTGDKVYFDKLYNQCFNKEVGHAFYCYLLEIDITNFDPQSYPMTSAKLDSMSKRLDGAYKFLRDEYILPKISKGLNQVTVKELYTQYEEYSVHKFKPKGKIEFNKSLENVGIRHKNSNGAFRYHTSLKELLEISQRFHWIHELDEFDEEELPKNNKITVSSKKNQRRR